MEAEFRQTPGVIATAVGYTGGTVDNPTYEMVCGGKTGHTEAVLVEFNPKQISFAQLIDVLWKSHPPRYPAKDQYRSAIFTFGAEQMRIALSSKSLIERELKKPIVAHIEPAGKFWLAEAYHQQYFDSSGVDACPIR